MLKKERERQRQRENRRAGKRMAVEKSTREGQKTMNSLTKMQRMNDANKRKAKTE